ncbi:unnamed protein product [Penicillium bialowiezense]
MSTSASECLLLGSLPLLVLSEWNSRSHTGTAVFKMLCSVAFLSHPFLLPSTEWSEYRFLITAGLGCSLLGDFCLIPSRREFDELRDKVALSGKSESQGAISISFQLGIVAFAAAHIFYSVAFLRDSSAISWLIFAATFLAALSTATWLGAIYPQAGSSVWSNVLNLAIPSDMKPLVSAYVVIIGVMFAAATSTSPPIVPSDWLHSRAVGAAMFVNAFGKSSGPKSRGLLETFGGYGLYFWAQIVIARTVIGA